MNNNRFEAAHAEQTHLKNQQANSLCVFAFFVGSLVLVMALTCGTSIAEQPDQPIPASNSDAEAKAISDSWFASNPPELPLGQKLFEQDFSRYKEIKNGGDGVGPMFNSVSCVGCHNQGDYGGGGGLAHNVHLLSVSDKSKRIAASALAEFHPGFINSDGSFVPSLLVHRHATDERYADFRSKLIDKKGVLFEETDEETLQSLLSRKPIRKLRPAKDLILLHSQRNTPPLFGIGLIEQIPAAMLSERATATKRFGIQGRVSTLNQQKIGKFGWRAQLPTLEEFVLSACANELGLEVEGHKQPDNPLSKETRLSVPELSTEETDAMTEYVSRLPAPKFEIPKDGKASVLRGLNLFNEIGCAECHVRNMGPAKDIFSDLLLHDLGSGLNDPVGASPEIETVTRVNPIGKGTRTFFDKPKFVNMYYTGTVLVPQFKTEPNDDPSVDVFQRFANTTRDPKEEWRTPPLWGCADSAPYMHDGRAATLTEAIQMHSGSSRKVRLNFTRLSAEEQTDVLNFLSCLKAPSVE